MTSTTLLRIAGSCLAVAMPSISHAQTCMWTTQSAPGGPFGSVKLVYDPIRARVLAVESVYGTLVPNFRLYAWSGSAWTLLNASGPPKRDYYAIAFDSSRDRLVLYGGRQGSQTLSPEVFEWDGASWTTVLPPGGLSDGRTDHAMAFDTQRGKVILFGGQYLGQPTNDMWMWDGVAWAQQSPANRPPARFAHSMVYDSIRGRVVMFGGRNTTSVLGDTWEWDGVTWTQRTGPGPAPPYGFGMAFDSLRGRIVVVGLFGPMEADGATWEFDGLTGIWSERARYGFRLPRVLTFDAAAGRTIIVEGVVYSYNPAASGLQPWMWVYDSAVYNPGETVVVGGAANGSPAPTYQWSRGGIALTNSGPYSGVQTAILTVTNAGGSEEGTYTLTATNPCGQVSGQAYLQMLGPDCFANCDRSWRTPVLTANDFQCYLNRFANGGSDANCDGSTATPLLTANDFQCFLILFAQGCT